MSLRSDQTYYEILEVSNDAPANEIHAAYRKAKETYCPNSPALYTMFSETEAKELLDLIEEAFQVLSNRAKRDDYDKQLNQGEAMTSSDKSTAFKVSTPAEVPEGFAKTKFGIYEVSNNFENELSLRENFDGEFLGRVRKYRGISIEQLSDSTRVSRTYLNAIETNDFEALPAAVFVRGFVIQVARLLQLDENKVAKSYMEFFKKGCVE